MLTPEQLDIKEKIDFVVKSLNGYIELSAQYGIKVDISINDKEIKANVYAPI